VTGLHAQDAIVSSCQDVVGNGGSLSYSVGQLACSCKEGTNGTLTEGVQQPYEISILTGVEEVKSGTIKCMVYPNPVSNFLIIKTGNYEEMDLAYQLYTSNGKLIEAKRTTGKETYVTLNNLLPAPYLLQVCLDHKVLKVFKIIKKY